jgi:hypothetical protein
MSGQGMVDGNDGTLTGKAPAARIFALVVLSLAVLLGSLLAVSAIGSRHDDRSAVSARPASTTGGGADGVLVVPKDEPKPKPKPAPKPERKKPVQTSSASSSPAPTTTSAAPATSSASPAPVQSAPAPTPTPAPAPAPRPAPKASSAAKKAPVQHTVVVTE